MIWLPLNPTELRTLQPQDVAAYLRSAGWQNTGDDGAKVSYWTWANAEAEVALPLTSAWRDYERRMADIVDILSQVENRSPTAIVDDLKQSGNDTLRVRLVSPLADDGTIPLTVGAATAGALESLILAAACSEIRPEPYYPSRKADQANDHVRRNVRLAQTERGSYVLKVLTRVPPKLSTEKLQPSIFDGTAPEEPYERRVSIRLARALDALMDAAAIAGNKQSMEPMVAAVQHGVSANLCDAVIGLAGETNEADLDLRFSWATCRPVEGERPRERISIPRSSFETLREASSVFKQNAPIREFKVSGWIVALDSDDPASGGIVTIEAPVFGYWRKITVHLAADSYRQAIDAHSKSQRVRLNGDLERAGKRFSLARPSRLSIAADDESEAEEFFP